MVKATKSHKGGWKSTKYLEWADIKDVTYLVSQCQLNCSIDIMPDHGTDQERKRFIQTITARIGQTLKRRGRDLIGVTVFEKGGPSNADLHGHCLMRIERKDRDIIERRDDGEIIRATWLTTQKARYKKAGYITKQRKRYSPDFEARNGHTYQKNPAPVPGRKISFTKGAARAILKARKALISRFTETVPSKIMPQAVKLTGQLEMFPELAAPVSRLKDFSGGTMSPAVAMELEFRRRRLGLSQYELGRLAGLSQPQIANVIHGRFGLSRSAAGRLKTTLEQVAA